MALVVVAVRAEPGSRRGPTSSTMRSGQQRRSPARPPSPRRSPASAGSSDLKAISGMPEQEQRRGVAQAPPRAEPRGAAGVAASSVATSEVTATRWSGSEAWRSPSTKAIPSATSSGAPSNRPVSHASRSSTGLNSQSKLSSPSTARRGRTAGSGRSGPRSRSARGPASRTSSSSAESTGREVPQDSQTRYSASSWPGQRVEARAVAVVHVAHHADALEGLEVAVDRGDVRGRDVARTGCDLLGAQRAAGPRQGFDDEPAGAGQPQSAQAHGLRRRVQVGYRQGGREVGRGHLTATVSRLRLGCN